MAEKRSFLYNVTMGKDSTPDFKPNKLPGTRAQVFKDIFATRLGVLVKLNFFVLLFALPLIVIIAYFVALMFFDGAVVPYSANIGIGYPVVTDAAVMGDARQFSLVSTMTLWSILGFVIASIGLAGSFHVMKKLVWGEGIMLGSNFFHGIKNNFLPFIISAFVLGGAVFSVVFNIGVYSRWEFNPVIKILGISISVIILIVSLCMSIFLFTQSVTYKLTIRQLLKNSLIFALGLLPQNLLILLLSAVPIVILWLLVSIPYVGMFAIAMFMFVGISYIVLLWTLYSHWAFDKFLNDKTEGAVKNKGLYIESEEEKQENERRKLLDKNTRFNNPKLAGKNIKSVDEGLSFSPLSESFNRRDLEKLAQEKELVKQEIDAQFEDIEGDVKDESLTADVKKSENDNSKKTVASADNNSASKKSSKSSVIKFTKKK